VIIDVAAMIGYELAHRASWLPIPIDGAVNLLFRGS